ncbi:hypothetical protein [Ewingella allii]|uniref:hypothetical protein n=1 Tax=Ewingella allii TaxID=3092550 RepID=UPI0037A20A2E
MTQQPPNQDFDQRFNALVDSLTLAPNTPDNQVIDRIALHFRKLLNFLTQDAELTQQAFGETQKAALVNAISALLAGCQQSGLFRQDLSTRWIARCFVGMLDQMKEEPGDAAARHQQSIGCAKILCEGIWPGAADARP